MTFTFSTFPRCFSLASLLWLPAPRAYLRYRLTIALLWTTQPDPLPPLESPPIPGSFRAPPFLLPRTPLKRTPPRPCAVRRVFPFADRTGRHNRCAFAAQAAETMAVQVAETMAVQAAETMAVQAAETTAVQAAEMTAVQAAETTA
eukprot:1165084-Pleurochrysis_carterae.AAC.1